MGGPLPTYSQNFIALAAIVSEMLMAFENDNYILDNIKPFISKHFDWLMKRSNYQMKASHEPAN